MRLICLTWACLAVFGCDSQKSPTYSPPLVSYAIVENGKTILPTNVVSQRLITLSGPDRLESMRDLVLAAHHQCKAVLEATLTGGLDGTDVWTVRCEGANWIIWFYPDGTQEVRTCDSSATCSI